MRDKFKVSKCKKSTLKWALETGCYGLGHTYTPFRNPKPRKPGKQ